MKQYRNTIDEGLKILQTAQRAPIEDATEFNAHVKNLKMRLAEIELTGDDKRNSNPSN